MSEEVGKAFITLRSQGYDFEADVLFDAYRVKRERAETAEATLKASNRQLLELQDHAKKCEATIRAQAEQIKKLEDEAAVELGKDADAWRKLVTERDTLAQENAALKDAECPSCGMDSRGEWPGLLKRLSDHGTKLRQQVEELRLNMAHRYEIVEHERDALAAALKPIQEEHARIEKWNAGSHGLPQGPCQCRVCVALSTLPQASPPTHKPTCGWHLGEGMVCDENCEADRAKPLGTEHGEGA